MRASLPDGVAYQVCAAPPMDEISWDQKSFEDLDQLSRDTEEAPWTCRSTPASSAGTASRASWGY
jgi:hypothetical protein